MFGKIAALLSKFVRTSPVSRRRTSQLDRTAALIEPLESRNLLSSATVSPANVVPAATFDFQAIASDLDTTKHIFGSSDSPYTILNGGMGTMNTLDGFPQSLADAGGQASNIVIKFGTTTFGSTPALSLSSFDDGLSDGVAKQFFTPGAGNDNTLTLYVSGKAVATGTVDSITVLTTIVGGSPISTGVGQFTLTSAVGGDPTVFNEVMAKTSGTGQLPFHLGQFGFDGTPSGFVDASLFTSAGSYDLQVTQGPTDIQLSNSAVPEHQPIGTLVGTLTTTDDTSDSFTYSLVSGDGDDDNSSFKIDGNNLEVNANLDFNTQQTYSVLIQTSDSNGLTFVEQFTIQLTPVSPARTLTVDTLGDGFVNGHMTLREAINLANADGPGDTINFANGLTGTISLEDGVITITNAMTIQGPGANVLSVSGLDQSQIFLNLSPDATISGLTLSHGKADSGAAIDNEGILHLINDMFTDNHATGAGGAILNNFDLYSTNTSYLNNSADTGGAINSTDFFSSTNDTFYNNVAASQGGAIEQDDTYPTLVNDTIVGNVAPVGAGVFGLNGILSKNSIITGNSTPGGSASNIATSAPMGTTGTTGSNVVPTSNALVVNSLIGDQTSATVIGVTNGVNGNIVGVGASSVFATDNMGNLLLASNGGSTLTIALKPGSPAIGAGNSIGTFPVALDATTQSVTLTTLAQLSNTFPDRSIFTAGEYLKLDSEIILVTDVVFSATDVVLTLERGQMGTMAAAHSQNAVMTLAADAVGAPRNSNDLGAVAFVSSGTLPVVTTNPQDVTVITGQPVTFTAAATGNPTPTIQWQVSTDGGSTFADISGATSATYAFTTVLAQNGNQYRAVFTNTAGPATTTAATLTVQPLPAQTAPVVTDNPVHAITSVGDTASFDAAASGNPTPTVQWQVSTDGGATFANISGATSTTLLFTTTAGQDGNLYRAIFTNTVGSATTNAALLTVQSVPPQTAPVVVTNPGNLSVSVGQTATFTAAAAGNPAPTVQWQVSTDGGATFTNISGAISTTYSFTTAMAQNGNKYRAVFTNAAGSAMTSPATLTVQSAPGLTAPVVTINPVNASVANGQTATFTATASGNPAPKVQWQFSSDGGATFVNISGAISGMYSFTTTATQNGNQYRAVFTNAAGTAMSAAATLTVLLTPKVTSQPTSKTVSSGDTVTLTAMASGNPMPTVQWQVSADNGSTFTNIDGATSTTLSFMSTSDQNGSLYRAVFTNTQGTATTQNAKLTVLFAPAVTTDPQDQFLTSEQPVTLTAAAFGNPVPTVQWQISKDGGNTFSNIAGATMTSYSFNAKVALDGAMYRAVFTNSQGTAITNAATLSLAIPPQVTKNPASVALAIGLTAGFSATASGNPQPTVQWQVSTDSGATFNDISGATSTLYTFKVTAATANNQYRAVFTNENGSATTTAATLTLPITLKVTSNPAGQSVSSGGTATFTATAVGTPTPSPQWQVSTDNGATYSDISGATSTTLSFATTSDQNNNLYRAVFTNAQGTVTTQSARLTVLFAPVVTTNPSDVTINVGQTATFTAAASGSPAPTVQWQVSTDNGATFNNINGAKSLTLSLPANLLLTGNLYRAVFTNSINSAMTTAAMLTVLAKPVVTSNPTSMSVSLGQTVTFSAGASGNPAPTVQWQVSMGNSAFTDLSGANSTTLSFTSTATQNNYRYRAVFTNSQGSATSQIATLTVLSAPAVTLNPTNVSIGTNKVATFKVAASGNPTPTVQWQVSTNGGATFTNIQNQTSLTLNVTTAASLNGNQYRAIFTNSQDTATTLAATLTVLTAPTVNTSPQNQSVSSGTSVTFTATASGNPTPNIQWQVKTPTSINFSNITGATSSTLTFTTSASQNGNQYQAVFTNSQGTVVSHSATLTVLFAPAVKTNPVNVTSAAGNTATFTAAATGSLTPTVQWQVSTDHGATFQNLSGQTSTTLKVAATADKNGNLYRAVFKNAQGTVMTTAATLFVQFPPIITQNPVSKIATVGSNVTFVVDGISSPAATFQWQVSADNGKTFTNISGATSATLSFTAAANLNGRIYQVVLKNSKGTTTSMRATLTIVFAAAVKKPGT